MTARLARLIVRAAAWMAPRAIRDRWREEWLAEMSASGKYGRAAAAPRDAIAAHVLGRIRLTHEPRGARIAGWSADVKYAIRGLRRMPGHVLTVTLCLGAALIGCLSVFSLVNTALYGDIPGIVDRQHLGALYIRSDIYSGDKLLGRRFGRGSVSAAEYDVIRKHGPGVAGVGAEGRLNVAMRLPDGEVVSVIGAFVSDNYFEVLGSSAVGGRLLGPADDSPAATAIVISHRLWQRQLGGRDTFSREPVLVGGRPMTIVGIAPDGFLGLEAATPIYIEDNRREVSVDVWLPMKLAATWPGANAERLAVLRPRNTVNFRMVVRPAAERSLDDAQRDLQASITRLDVLVQQYRDNRAVVRPFGRGYHDTDVMVLALVSMLLAAPMLVLIIACANVANLRLARFVSQQRELAVRLSLGGTRVQVLRLLVIETAALAALAAFVGWAGATLVLWQFGSFLPGGAQMDYRVFVFGTALVAMAIGLSGVAPAWLTTKRLAVAGLRQTTQAGGLGHARLRHSLVVVQVALSIVLLLVGALFTRSVQSIAGAAPAGIDELLVADLDLSQMEKQPAELQRFLDALVQRLGTDGRAQHVAVANIDIYGHASESSSVGNETQYLRSGDPPTARNHARIGHVTPAWFDAMGLNLLGGRTFRPDEAGPVAVVNRTFADRFGAGRSPVGQVLQIRPFDRTRYDVQIIGVVSDAPKQPDHATAQPAIYLPLREATGPGFTLYVRAANAEALIRDLRRTLSDLDSRAPWAHFETATSRLARDTDPFRYLARSVASLGILALLLAMAGLYAVIAYVVSLRTHEIGVRVAIGARAADVVRLVLGQAMRLVVLGVAVGFLIALPLVSYIREIFLGVSPFDPLAIVPTAALLLTVALAAAALPARRAARIDPIRALRTD